MSTLLGKNEQLHFEVLVALYGREMKNGRGYRWGRIAPVGAFKSEGCGEREARTRLHSAEKSLPKVGQIGPKDGEKKKE